MTALETVLVILITPVSALLIAWWVLYDNRKMGEAARRRAELAQRES